MNFPEGRKVLLPADWNFREGTKVFFLTEWQFPVDTKTVIRTDLPFPAYRKREESVNLFFFKFTDQHFINARTIHVHNFKLKIHPA